MPRLTPDTLGLEEGSCPHQLLSLTGHLLLLQMLLAVLLHPALSVAASLKTDRPCPRAHRGSSPSRVPELAAGRAGGTGQFAERCPAAPAAHLQHRLHSILTASPAPSLWHPCSGRSFSQPLALAARAEGFWAQCSYLMPTPPQLPSHLPPSSSPMSRLELQEKRSTAPHSSPASPAGRASSS